MRQKSLDKNSEENTAKSIAKRTPPKLCKTENEHEQILVPILGKSPILFTEDKLIDQGLTNDKYGKTNNNRPNSLDYFISNTRTKDINDRFDTCMELRDHLRTPGTAVSCSDMHDLVDVVCAWVKCSNLKVCTTLFFIIC